MTAATEPRLKVKSMIPVFELESVDGKRVNLWDYKGRKHMVLAFLPPDCPICLDFMEATADAYHQYEEEYAVFLPVIVGRREQAEALQDELHPPYPILFDQHGKVAERYADRLPAIFVADKFGQLYAEWIIEPGEQLPTQREILDVLDAIELECPE
ncbi:MAG TPA: redoxin domain-containing protein [Armatimonadota bacterium]|nr:redoxin domain-containing protein [Armatimonadota bacterium]